MIQIKLPCGGMIEIGPPGPGQPAGDFVNYYNHAIKCDYCWQEIDELMETFNEAMTKHLNKVKQISERLKGGED